VSWKSTSWHGTGPTQPSFWWNLSLIKIDLAQPCFQLAQYWPCWEMSWNVSVCWISRDLDSRINEKPRTFREKPTSEFLPKLADLAWVYACLKTSGRPYHRATGQQTSQRGMTAMKKVVPWDNLSPGTPQLELSWRITFTLFILVYIPPKVFNSKQPEIRLVALGQILTRSKWQV
jgi:hypothetical protein